MTADLKFKVKRDGKTAKGILEWPAKGLSAAAISGPYGGGAIADGLYQAPRRLLLDKVGETAYCDSIGGKGHCWMQGFEPTTTRTDLGIHPDGNIQGTEGCIGIVASNDTKPWYDAFYKSTGLTVEVTTES